MKKKFIVILSCGRCASTSVVNFLNTDNRFNIYGENKSFIINLLNTINSLDFFSKRKQSKKINQYEKYINKKYCFSEFYYDDHKQLFLIKNQLINILKNFFDESYEYIGFKDIEWNQHNIDSLSLLENLYNVKYVFLERNLSDLLPSFQKTIGKAKNIKDCQKYILSINCAIKNFLSTKNIKKFIHINISENNNFLNEIKHFIINND
jgi:hypothetical protein